MERDPQPTPTRIPGPLCEDVNHDDPPAAVAVIPLVSYGQHRAYAHMMVCRPCLIDWRVHTEARGLPVEVLALKSTTNY